MHDDYITSTMDAAIARLEAALPPVHGAPFWMMTRDVQGFKVTCFLSDEFAERTHRRAGSFAVVNAEAAAMADAVNGAADQLDHVLSAGVLG